MIKYINNKFDLMGCSYPCYMAMVSYDQSNSIPFYFEIGQIYGVYSLNRGHVSVCFSRRCIGSYNEQGYHITRPLSSIEIFGIPDNTIVGLSKSLVELMCDVPVSLSGQLLHHLRYIAQLDVDTHASNILAGPARIDTAS